MINTIGERQCEKALQIGKIYKPKEALKIHLVDELANSEDLLKAAEDQMKKWISISSNSTIQPFK
jgi:3,2-trans-enoyl-CoA isomerase